MTALPSPAPLCVVAVLAQHGQALAQVMADVMGAEAALARAQFVSGTHAIATALFTALRPGDELLAVAGKPYDTLEEVIGLRGTPGAQVARLQEADTSLLLGCLVSVLLQPSISPPLCMLLCMHAFVCIPVQTLRWEHAGHGSLREWGVHYREVPLTTEGHVDLGALEEAVCDTDRAPLWLSIGF